MPTQIVPITYEIYQVDFPKQFFKSAPRKDEWAASFLELYVFNLLSAKIRLANCFKYWQNLSVRFSKSTKRAMRNSFCRVALIFKSSVRGTA